jgi:two-component system chemotaxis response regulator CheB
VRASANPLFATAAKTCGVDVIAVVLTGYGRDATDGVQTVRVHGGLVIAQDEATSRDFGMPRSAIESSAVDVVLPLERIGPFISELVSRRGQAQTATG